MKIQALISAIVLSALCASVYAAEGSLRFSGRISDPPCAAGQAAQNSSSIELQNCPLGASGAQISVESLQAGDSVKLASDAEPGEINHLRVPVSSDSQLSFSQSYQLASNEGSAAKAGSYLVRVDYP